MSEDQQQPTFNVEASKELFERNREVRNRIMNAGVIIQNSGEVSQEEIAHAREELKACVADLKQWWGDVIAHINNCNK